MWQIKMGRRRTKNLKEAKKYIFSLFQTHGTRGKRYESRREFEETPSNYGCVRGKEKREDSPIFLSSLLFSSFFPQPADATTEPKLALTCLFSEGVSTS